MPQEHFVGSVNIFTTRKESAVNIFRKWELFLAALEWWLKNWTLPTLILATATTGTGTTREQWEPCPGCGHGKKVGHRCTNCGCG